MSNRTVKYDPALRMIEFVLHLDQGRREWPLAEIATTMEVSERTIRRYVGALSKRFVNDEGEPRVHLERRKDGLFVVSRGSLLSPDPSLDYASVFLASKLLDFASDSVLKGNIERIAGVLKSKAKGEERNALARFARKFYVHHTSMQRSPADREVVQHIMRAVVNELRLTIRYEGKPEPMTVEPLCLRVAKEILYLDLHFPGKTKLYTFAVPMIQEAKVTAEKFKFPDDWLPAEAHGDKFGVMPGKLIDLTLVFPPDRASYVRTRTWHRSQHVQVRPDGRVQVTMRTTLSPELVSWIVGLGGQVYVESPLELREQVREQLAAGLAQYQSP